MLMDLVCIVCVCVFVRPTPVTSLHVCVSFFLSKGERGGGENPINQQLALKWK